MKNYLVLLMLICFVFSCTPINGPVGATNSQQDSLATQKVLIGNKVDDMDAKIKVDPSITIEYLMGKFNPEKHSDFIVIEKKYADRVGRYMRKDAYEAYLKMYEAAKKEGVNFKIISGVRAFDAQKYIWERKWTGKRKTTGVTDITKTIPDPTERALKILEYSSMPGTSRHHWGTDIDINALTNSYFEKGKGKKEYDWLKANAASFGFCQPYSPKGKNRPNGYNEEKWHWSYLPIAKKLSDQYRLRLSNENITGFLGAETAVKIKIIEKYVLGINEECL